MFKLQRPREFKIETYYYDQNENVDPKRRIQFKRIRHSKPVTKGNPLRLVMFVLILIFVIYYLQKKADVWQGSSGSDKIIVEEVIVVD